MYSQRIKDKAFELYCIHGGIKPVVGLLKKEFSACKNINRKTLTKWAAEDKWDERKANVREQIHEQHDQKIGEAIGDIEKRLQDEVDKVFTCLKDLEPKSFAEAIHSLPTMFTQLRKLRGEDGVTDVQQAISRILKAMLTVPAFKHLMEDEGIRLSILGAIEAEFAKT